MPKQNRRTLELSFTKSVGDKRLFFGRAANSQVAQSKFPTVLMACLLPLRFGSKCSRIKHPGVSQLAPALAILWHIFLNTCS